MAKHDKQLKKELKAQAKLAKMANKQSLTGNEDQLNSGKQSTKKVATKISKETKAKIKVKPEKEKVDIKLAFKEFPIKMAKEVNKIKWSGRENLTRKFIIVILFMLFFAVLFFFVDWGLQQLFVLIKVI
ncbi:preprotein translocase subunit SecE [Mesoplasma seiffertii]|uniref:preprotein translocase subunit SecE n=1 Tax=Mesoplasma seiffertii TaxID=28224 RepID=UPI001FE04463|nr:preprotein translocase subunit SecE [Mesoplasma seiffertii]